jgi:hypothetical protein
LQQSFAFLPTIQGGNAAIPNFASSSAYPAPGQQNDYSKSSIGGYPAPGQEKITNPNQGYPAP